MKKFLQKWLGIDTTLESRFNCLQKKHWDTDFILRQLKVEFDKEVPVNGKLCNNSLLSKTIQRFYALSDELGYEFKEVKEVDPTWDYQLRYVTKIKAVKIDGRKECLNYIKVF